MLYDPYGYQYITDLLADLLLLTGPPANPGTPQAAAQDAAHQALVALITEARAGAGRPSYAFPYDNGREAFSSVLCTDGLNPADAAAWPGIGAAADDRAPYFGRLWAWSSSPCASDTWRARDEDAYRGPFTRVTSAPVLVIGTTWDPATIYEGAVQASRLLPASRLLTSESWGHTAYGSSACVNDAVAQYLVAQALPPEGAVCRGDVQPFEALPEIARLPARPPVVPLVPPGVPVR
jgi:hypothetical protein